MCGRFSNKIDKPEGWEAIITDWPKEQTSYNVAPTTRIPVITKHGTHIMRWGLVPSWSKEPTTQYHTHNAKLETVQEKATFRNAWSKNRRCLIPVQGYYEWRTEEGVKQPYFVTTTDGSPIVFGGLWENWQGDDEKLSSCTILTKEPTGALAELHHRMPVMLSPETAIGWLNEEEDEAGQIAQQAVPAGIEFYQVSQNVGNVRTNDSSLTNR